MACWIYYSKCFINLKLYIYLPPESKNNFFSFHWLTELLKTQVASATVAIIIFIIILLTRIEKAFLKTKKNNPDHSFLKVPNVCFKAYNKHVFAIGKTACF